MYATCTLNVTATEHGSAKKGVTVQVQLLEMPAGTGCAELSRLWEVESGEGGLASFVGAIQGAKYRIKVKNGRGIIYTATTDATQNITNIHGVG